MLKEKKAHEFQSFQNPKHHVCVCVCRPWSPKTNPILPLTPSHLSFHTYMICYMCYYARVDIGYILITHISLQTYVWIGIQQTSKHKYIHTYIHTNKHVILCVWVYGMYNVSCLVWEAMYEWIYSMGGGVMHAYMSGGGDGGQETMGVKVTYIPLFSLSLCLSCFLSNRVNLLVYFAFLWTHTCKNVGPLHPIV